MRALGPDLFAELNGARETDDSRIPVFGHGGLDAAQIADLEQELAFAFPDDLKLLLGNTRDTQSRASPWAALDRASYQESMAYILDGIEFDVEYANLWLCRWGEQPRRLAAALDIARQDFTTWPRLFPLFGHRFLAIEPCLNDNPVFSIVQTDIICYGANLAHYLVHEFVASQDYAYHTIEQKPRYIDIWSDFAEDRDKLLAWPSGLVSADRAPWRQH